MKKEILVLALGSNVGNRHQYLQQARASLVLIFGPMLAESPVYESDPWGVQHSTRYLNQVLVFATEYDAVSILEFTQEAEKKMGRRQKGDLSPRTLDIDILYLGRQVVQKPQLFIPHPRIEQRKFVLQPLEDVLPGFLHPVLLKSQKELNRQPETLNQIIKVWKPMAEYI